eukprot:TRINITY_DN6381_c0_g1_i4.p2 TRINITY_DN6381_c0_g1~~TRINITY_DN6381_c0_g1_i4.p2  ORF type:complete len:115 (-),score=26.24 TRINITY_DN6381_c0_g1_i4:600-914(-)
MGNDESKSSKAVVSEVEPKEEFDGTLNVLPWELVLRIFSFADIGDLIQMSQVNSLYRALLTKNSIIWRDHYQSSWWGNNKKAPTNDDMNWRKLCIERYWFWTTT